ncbi:MAG: T9SS type A sorting domain-containing protein [Bacteroidales bacterium]
MKRILLFAFALGFALSSVAQTRLVAPQNMRDYAVKKDKAITETMNFSHEVMPAADFWPPLEAIAGNTYYDLQSNASMQNRIHLFDDGTVGLVWTTGWAHPAFATDRGTGYNYYDGNNWGPWPTEKIEPNRTGWPAYAPWGEGGEVVLNHVSGTAGLTMGTRATKGTGAWNWQINMPMPAGVTGLLWPRMATGGIDNSVIHILPLTSPTGNGGTLYQGMDGAILYGRSTDGGVTWNPEPMLIPEIGPTYYDGFSGDTYEIQARGDVVAILTGDSWVDMTLLKSTDGGDTWTKTVIWECPYPNWPGGQTDTFYCVDGTHALAIDQTGTVHVAFGINRAHEDNAGGSFWFPLVDGVGYWKEGRPTFSNHINALNPYSDAPYTELVDDYSLIGWAQDVNNNGTWDVLSEIGLYYFGASSQPSIHVDDDNNVFVVWSHVTETYDNGLQNFRHLWARVGYSGGDWWGSFFHLTSDLVHIFDECVFASISHTSDNYIHLVYQTDNEPGLAVRGDEDPYGENFMRYMQVAKMDLIETSIGANQLVSNIEVSQNSPNPFRGESTVFVTVKEATNLSLNVTNMVGQVVYTYNAGVASPGLNKLPINGSNLSRGVYFYTVKAGETAITKKMIVE